MPINWPYDLVFIDELAESSFAAVFVWNMHVLNKRHMCLKLTQEQVIEKKKKKKYYSYMQSVDAIHRLLTFIASKLPSMQLKRIEK